MGWMMLIIIYVRNYNRKCFVCCLWHLDTCKCHCVTVQGHAHSPNTMRPIPASNDCDVNACGSVFVMLTTSRCRWGTRIIRVVRYRPLTTSWSIKIEECAENLLIIHWLLCVCVQRTDAKYDRPECVHLFRMPTRNGSVHFMTLFLCSVCV